MATDRGISLSRYQRSELSSIAQSRSLPAEYVFRARLILMLAEGASFSTIKRRLQTSAPTIIRWKQRFLQFGLDGLDTYHPARRPPWSHLPCGPGFCRLLARNPAMGRHTGVAANWR